ncbi:MAG: cytochrome c3 family protein [Planctomycetota bacterium]
MTLTGKQRAQRISRGYHRLEDPYIARKRLLGMAGLAIGLAYAAWMFTGASKKHVSTGELSQAHYHLNDSGCEKCHIPYSPIRFDALWGNDSATVQLNNRACNGSCHQVADHFAGNMKPEVQAKESCSRCHQEHLGRNRNLLDVADSNCNRCHADLSQSSTTDPSQLSRATDFSKLHPKLSFENLEKDPSTLLFSHTQHMRPGQPKTPGDAAIKKLTDLKPEHRAKYANRADAAGLIQLTCSDCHDRDTPVPGAEGLEAFDAIAASGLAIPSSTHRLYNPVDFEKHCIACHTLNDLPHGLNRTQTFEALQQRLKTVSVDDAEKLLSDQSGLPSKIAELIQDRRDRASVLASHVADTCRKCHALASETDTDLVQRVDVKTRWLDDAAFTHGKHLMVACSHCHADAYARSEGVVESDSEARKIMIAGLDSCRECHIQAPGDRAKASAFNPHVASADCIDCHRYHVDTPQTPPSMGSHDLPFTTAAAPLRWLRETDASR